MTLLTILLAFFFNFGAAHPIHIAISEIHYSKENKSLQVMHKIFMDDLEDHIKKIESARGKTIALHLGSEKESSEADAYIETYIKEHFNIKVDGKTLIGKYLGKEYETDAVWMYVEIENVVQPKQIEVMDAFLMDFHSDQSNFVHFNIGGQKKSLRFFSDKRKQEVGF
ncbi:MAG: DUF6702 family protein [Saprospiraceae bacterium]|nr:DUF6702 family protein [Saprospiraceae bacterium]